MAKKKKDEDSEEIEQSEDEMREKALKELYKLANKNFGEGTLYSSDDHKFKITNRISTGILPLDWACGGGIPVGRISLWYGHKSSGKTTSILRTIGNAQKMCSACWTRLDSNEGSCLCKKNRKVVVAWLDVEGVWDSEWSSRFLSINENLILSQPGSAEQAIDLAHAAVTSMVDILVIDSIAFMTPQTEQDKSASEQTIGLQARLLGNFTRKMVSATNELGKTYGYRPTILLTNQIRQKVGVMYGCFHGDDIVHFADGRRIPIRNVVKEKISGDVLSYDKETRMIKSYPITNWFNNGKIDYDAGQRWLSFRTTGAGGLGGEIGFTCTPNHTLFRIDGSEVSAGDVQEGEKLMSYYESRVLPYASTVKRIEVASAKKHRDLTKYDLEISDNGNYIIGSYNRGVVVHNSPDTTPGGLATGFSTSLEILTKTGKYEMDDKTGRPILVENKAKINKNKTAMPQIEAEWKVAMSKMDNKNIGDIIDEDWAVTMGEKAGIISVAPQNVEWDGKKFRGPSLLDRYFRDHPDEYTKFKSQLMPLILAT